MNTKEHIIQTASQLFYDIGYNSVGINQIIKESGIAKATLYAHFRTKEELFIAYLDAMDKQFMSGLMDFVGSKAAGDERLHAVIEFLYSFFNQENFNGCWCIRSIAEVTRENKEVRSKIKQNKDRLLNYFKLLTMENKPDMSGADQAALGTHLYMLYESAVGEAHLHNDSWPIDAALEMLKLRLDKC